MKGRTQLGSRSGFTMIEIMLVVIIIGVLAAMVVPNFAGRTQQARTARAVSDIANIATSIDLYELDHGKYPESLDELVSKEPPSGTGIDPNAWNGPYLKKGLPKDPWNRQYEYNKDSQHNQEYDLFSLGADGAPGNDDVTNWNE